MLRYAPTRPMLKDSFFEFVINHSLKVLLLTFTLMSLIIFLYLSKISNEQIQTNALKTAALYTEILTLFRTLYTSEVVQTAKNSGVTITHDYQEKANSIPLPATLAMMLGNRLGNSEQSVSSQLYSPYPFPWRLKTGGLTDNFSQKAWKALTRKPTQPYYQFENVNGYRTLRYASADLMRESCVNCHNAHLDTPKNDWKTGDLRGILEINIPIDQYINLASQMVRNTLYLLVAILAVTLLGIGSIIKQLQLRTNQALEAQQKLLTISLTDSLTGIANRRRFDQDFKLEWQRAQRMHSSLAVVLFDVDNFKAFNDNYGHQQGDDILQQLAQTMKNSVRRASDLIARYGGEEFILLLPNTTIAEAVAIADIIRLQVAKDNIEHAHSTAAQVVTVSAGVAAAVPSESYAAHSLVKSADLALYQAKSAGRNCVISFKESSINPAEKVC